MTQGEHRVVEVEKLAKTLEERIESLRRDLERATGEWRDTGAPIWREQIAQVSGKLDLVVQDLGRTKDDVKEMNAIRWEIWKMILTPLISAILSAIVSGVVASIVVQRSPVPAVEQVPRPPAKRP